MYEAYIHTIVGGIVFNCITIISNGLYYSMFPRVDIQTLSRRLKDKKKINYLWIAYFFPFSVGFYNIFTAIENTIFLVRKGKE